MSTSPPEPGPWVEQWLSAPRFRTYLLEAGGERQHALDLYEWNAAMAAAILHDLAHVEVAVRNAYNRALEAHRPGPLHWTEDELRYFPVMWRTANNGRRYENETPREQLAAARRKVGFGAPTGKVVAELMFGFWRYLSVSAREVTLWRPYLHHGFVAGTSRSAVDGAMNRLHRLRNRVAHHEPLLTQNLTSRRQDVLALLGFISPDLQTLRTSSQPGRPSKRSGHDRLPALSFRRCAWFPTIALGMSGRLRATTVVYGCPVFRHRLRWFEPNTCHEQDHREHD